VDSRLSSQTRPIPGMQRRWPSVNRTLVILSNKFLGLLKSELGLEKVTEKLEQWYHLESAEFVEQLMKIKRSLTLSQKSEWIEYFEKQKAIVQILKSSIDVTDREIDNLVYVLHGLSRQEIGIVEGVIDIADPQTPTSVVYDEPEVRPRLG